MTHQIDAPTKSPIAKLTNKQQLFCLIFVSNGGNATQAAIEAGYSKKYANRQAHQLLDITRLQDEIARLQTHTVVTHIVNRETITQAHADIAFDTDLGTHERQRSLDSLAKMGGMFVNISINPDLDKYQVFRDAFDARQARDKLPQTIDGEAHEIIHPIE